MKYFGEKSLSSFLSAFFRIAVYVVLVAAVAFGLVGVVILFIPVDHPALLQVAQALHANPQDPEWLEFKNLHLVLRMFMVPYYIAVVTLTILLMNRARDLFTNFAKDRVFTENNVTIIARFAKLLIVYAIMTFDVSTLIVSILLLMLCEIFKNGTALQQEHDLTV